MEYTGGSLKADHLCVLVHGLWGNPEHMKSVAKTVRRKFAEQELYLLVAKRNSGNFTYDGIERGGERVCCEIEEELAKIRQNGGNIRKISIVGYSLGGLVVRYAVGLLKAKGIFDSVQPVNFVTFATPHLGVRSPTRGWHGYAWNELGARTLSTSGQQLFTVDDFRGSGRLLLTLMTDPNSVFMSGLSMFKRKTLYANVINDRSVNYYTAMIAKTDPYRDTDQITAHYLPGYEGVILDPSQPFTPRSLASEGKTINSVAQTGLTYAKDLPLGLLLVTLLPVGIMGYLVNAAIQTFRSSRRIRLYDQGVEGFDVSNYRVPLMIKGLRSAVEDVYEGLNASRPQEYFAASANGSDDELDEPARATMKLERAESRSNSLAHNESGSGSEKAPFPTLALAPQQFDMIRNLDRLGWRKYPVWIKKHRHSHAAIIVRMEKESFAEGQRVLDHFVDEEFLI